MKIFVTGANGFIGGHVARKLIERGHEIVCLVRDPARADKLAQAGAALAKGDITERDSMVAPMRGSDVVFHLAGLYVIGNHDANKLQAINVDGARNTLQLAAELGVPKIIHTSTLAVFGNTHGSVPDESYRIGIKALGSEYERSKWRAHYEVAEPLQKKGAPLIIVQPGAVIGPGDYSPLRGIYKFYLNRMPIMFGADSGVCWAHVEDTAEAHVMAMEHGKLGENYIISGPPLTYKAAMQRWEKLIGMPAPKLWAPNAMASLTSKILGVGERVGINVPDLSSEGLASLAGYTFYGSNAKALRELHWQPRDLDETFKETLKWELAQMK